MQTELYDEIKKGLSQYIESLKLQYPYKPKPKKQGEKVEQVVGFSPSEPSYPLIIIDEVDNTPYQNMSNYRQTVASVSYKVDIYAKTSGSITKQAIARTLAEHCNDYLKCINLKQVSYNAFPNEGTNGAIYHITLMYSARYFENKQYFV